MHKHLEDRITEPAPIVDLRFSLLCQVVWHPSEKTHGIWLARWIHRDPKTGLTPFPLDTLLPPHDMVTTIEPMQEGICPLVPTMERGIVVRVEVMRR